MSSRAVIARLATEVQLVLSGRVLERDEMCYLREAASKDECHNCRPQVSVDCSKSEWPVDTHELMLSRLAFWAKANVDVGAFVIRPD